MNSTTIRKIEPAGPDCAMVSDIISRAFEFDPLLNWIALKDQHQARRLRMLVKATVDIYLPVSETYIDTCGKGCALWVKPSSGACTGNLNEK